MPMERDDYEPEPITCPACGSNNVKPEHADFGVAYVCEECDEAMTPWCRTLAEAQKEVGVRST